jgi:hypothetical protein
MNTEPLPRISEVLTGPSGLILPIRWQRPGDSSVDVGGSIRPYRLYRPLRDNPALFASAHVGDYGIDVVGADVIDVAADPVWRLAARQGTTPAQLASGSANRP